MRHFLLLFCILICIASPVFSQGWVAQTSGTTWDLYSVFLKSGTTGWACGLGGFTIPKTTDGGTTWTNIDVTKSIGISCRSIFFIDNNNGWIAADLGIYKTTDGGTTWTHPYNGYNVIHSVFFLNSTTGWAVGEGGTALKSTDGGSTWASSTIGLSTDKWYAVYFSENLTGWAVAAYGGIDKTTDGGANWTQQTFDLMTNLRSVQFIDNTTGWSVGDGGNIKKTTDGGTTWNKMTSGTTSNLQSVFFINSTTGWAVGNSGTVLYTTDGGTTWTSQTSGTTKTLYSVYFTDNNTGWAVGQSGTILKTTSGGGVTSVGQDATGLPQEFALQQNYPNPFNPTTNIKFGIKNFGLVSLKIYNVLGQEITTLIDEIKPAGSYTVPWNANGLPSGMYICRLKSGEMTRTMKITLLK